MADVLTVEIGSTITKVNAFSLGGGVFTHVAQGFAPTSVAQGDVGIGVDAALREVGTALGEDPTGLETFVNSSAAGGLRMTVHGLTASMTARAAREASLGAGAIVTAVTAGPLESYDLDDVREIAPNMVLLAGGVDHGETRIVLRNAELLAELLSKGLGAEARMVPVVYAGNKAIVRPITRIFEQAGVEILLADNVFPDVDVLNVGPLRNLIHEVFSRHIVHAPGMSRLAGLTHAEILPTPGAVLRAAELFSEAVGDAVIIDVGGATTDVHSVTDGSIELSAKMLEPEPRSKRTVEGDLGVFVNAENIARAVGDETWSARLADLRAMPSAEREIELTQWLCTKAVEIGVRRHAGTLDDIYTPTGKKQVVRGKDLTAVEWVVATGGALTKVAGGEKALQAICLGAQPSTGPTHLLPPPEARVFMDRKYLFSALGTLAHAYPDEVRETFRRRVQESQNEEP
ncbi:glutamate mutase L [Gephyromycinifex aptenodytis]|uniref:glutamate mutase L n=1 Tax=Gephyromycinifex aptenodytis TaxID=2716227 RepID=UPI001447050A|nr:glutamate mutase L [Gephyromycinifex aptenodytis]